MVFYAGDPAQHSGHSLKEGQPALHLLAPTFLAELGFFKLFAVCPCACPHIQGCALCELVACFN